MERINRFSDCRRIRAWRVKTATRWRSAAIPACPGTARALRPVALLLAAQLDGEVQAEAPAAWGYVLRASLS